MSVTLAATSFDVSIQLENVVNRTQRHCKIGKVARKPFWATKEDPIRLYIRDHANTDGEIFGRGWWELPIVPSITLECTSPDRPNEYIQKSRSYYDHWTERSYLPW